MNIKLKLPFGWAIAENKDGKNSLEHLKVEESRLGDGNGKQCLRRRILKELPQIEFCARPE